MTVGTRKNAIPGRLGQLAGLRRTVSRFRREEDGGMIIFGLYILVAMMIVSGIAFDVMRFETERMRTQSALDRAVLAAASMSQPLDGETVVNSYFEKANLDSSAVDVVEDRGLNFRTVEATSRVEVPTRFMRMVDRTMLLGQLSDSLAVHDGVFTLGTGSGAAAEQSIPKLEISLVLDVSGSMSSRTASGNTRIFDLRNAAREFSNLMLCDPNGVNATGNCSVVPGNVSISLVPYAEQVVADESLIDAIDDPTLSQYDISDEHQVSGCVTFDDEDFDTLSFSASDDVKRTGHFDPWTRSGTAASNWTCKFDEWRKIRPFVGHQSNLNWLIGNLRAGGNTSIDVAMKWGVSLLNPEMRSVIQSLSNTARAGGAPQNEPDFPGRPVEYDDRETLKVVVIMSDGENTSQHYLLPQYRSGPSEFWKNEIDNFYVIYRESSNSYYYPVYNTWATAPDFWWNQSKRIWERRPDDVHQLSYPDLWAEINTDYFEDFSWLPNPVASVGGFEKDSRLDAICDEAKDSGIVVFSIGFDAPTRGRSVLQNCASTLNHYYDADGLNIDDAFISIASAINNLRLTQ